MSTQLALGLAVLLLIFNAFFVGAEFAVISARRSSMEPLAQAGDRRAKTVLWAMEHVSLMLACAQLGITVCSIGLGVVAEPALARVIEGPLVSLGASASLAHPIAFVLALAIVVYLHVVLGEMVPKNVAVSTPDRAALWFGPPLVWIARAVRPLIAAMDWIANHVVRWSGVEPKGEVASVFTAQEVQSIVERSQQEGVLRDDLGLLSGAIEFSDLTAAEVMVGLDELVILPPLVSPEDVEKEVTRTGFSRFPVGEGPGNLSGYLHLKDVLYADDAGATSERSQPVPSWRVRALAVIDADAEIEDALREMQRTGAHLGRVVRAGTDVGVLFLEDILEELVGEVRDAMQRGHRMFGT